MTDAPTAEPEVEQADLATRLRNALISPGDYATGPGAGRDRFDYQRDAVLRVLHDDGWVLDGVPPVRQVLADARVFADELVLSKLVARFFRTMILGANIIPETVQIMDWLRDYIDGNLQGHGPLGKPMIWPDRLPFCAGLLRQWGYQPTPTRPPYVSPRPGGALSPVPDQDPQAPDPRSVKPLADGREANMGALLDEITGSPAFAVDRMTALRAMSAAFDRGATHADPEDTIAALKPFAEAFENIGTEDDEEWARMRLLRRHYRIAQERFLALGGVLDGEIA